MLREQWRHMANAISLNIDALRTVAPHGECYWSSGYGGEGELGIPQWIELPYLSPLYPPPQDSHVQMRLF